jgi:hypothetical protein
VNTEEVATPLALVVSVSVIVPLVMNVPLAMNVPPAPLVEGAVNVTATPLAGDPLDVTVAASGSRNAVPIVAFCGVPLVAVIDVEPPQLVKKPKARQMKARMLA